MIAAIRSRIGLYGLSAYTSQQKTKKTGNRKVHGASIWRTGTF